MKRSTLFSKCKIINVSLDNLHPSHFSSERIKSQFRRFILISTILGSPPTLAQSTDIILSTESITANRIARTARETLTPMTIITQEDINRLQARTLPEVLQGQIGLGIANSGGMGKATSFFLRGGNADHVLVLVDGIKIGSPSLGQAPLATFPLSTIERIEIVRGPRSSLYGSEAIGGVIQIFTRTPQVSSIHNNPMNVVVDVGAGTYNTAHSHAAFSGLWGEMQKGWMLMDYSRLTTQGYDTCKGSRNSGCFTIEPDLDGYQNQSLQFRTGWRFNARESIDINGLITRAKNEFDGASNNESTTMTKIFGVSGNLIALDGWDIKLRAGKTIDASDNFLNTQFKNQFDTSRTLLTWQNDLTINAQNRVVIGVDWQRDAVDSSFYTQNRRNTGVFAQYLGEFDPARSQGIEVSWRHDNNQQYGQQNTGALAWGMNVAQELRLSASLGTAFKAPTFNQLYYPNYGTAQLKPERSRSINLGVVSHGSLGRWSINAYQTRISDLIGSANSRAVNINSARIRGIELEASTLWMGWDWRMNLTKLSTENITTDSNNGNRLPRRANQTASLSMDRSWGDWKAGASIQGEGARYDDIKNHTRLGGYATLNLRTEYRINPAWRVQAKMDNAFNKDYETAYNYRQPGRSYYVTMVYQPQR